MSSSRHVAWVLVVAGVLVASVLLVPRGPARAQSCVGGVDSDFNGDGVKDIAIGDALGVVGGVTAGKVEVRYGGTEIVQEISQAPPSVPGVPEANDLFGTALASYDYNRDGCSDLVIGAPEESVGGKESAGMVTIIPGGVNGLFTQESFALHQGTPGIPGVVEQNDRFGKALAAGHTRSGEPFLAIGVPDEGVGNVREAGAVHYIRGDLNVMVHQNTPGVPGGNEYLDSFGSAIVGTRDHLIVASPTEDIASRGRNRGDAGSIHVFRHAFSSTGSPRWARMIHQDTPGVSGVPEAGDEFGGGYPGVSGEGGLSAVAYRPNGVPDRDAGSLIAVGVPGEDFGAVNRSEIRGDGLVHLLYVSRSGALRQVWNLHQDNPGVAGRTEPVDLFGDEVSLLGNRAYEATTPDTTRLLVAAPGERANDARGVFQLFSLAGAPGNADILIANGTFGLSYGHIGPETGVTDTDLYIEGPQWWEITVVPWANILDGASQSVHSIRSIQEGTDGFYGIAMQ